VAPGSIEPRERRAPRRLIVSALIVFAFAFWLANTGHAASRDEAAAPVPVDVMLKPIYAPVMRGRSVSQYALLDLRLTVDGEAARVRASQYLPILRDRFIAHLNGQSILRNQGRDGIDFEAMKERLQRRADAVLGKDIVMALTICRLIDFILIGRNEPTIESNGHSTNDRTWPFAYG